MGGSIWDHDLWQNIYSIQDADARTVCIALYRLILDMRNDEVLAAAVAKRIHAEHVARENDRTFKLTAFQKIIAILGGSVVLADSLRGLIFG